MKTSPVRGIRETRLECQALSELATSETKLRCGHCVTQRQALNTRVRRTKRSARLALGRAHVVKPARNTSLNVKRQGAVRPTPG